MGKASKQKGRRMEYVLRNYLRQMGWAADRVYASGAIAGLPGDVKASKGERTLLFEMKARKDSFSSLYEMYQEHVRTKQDDLLSFAMPCGDKTCVAVSTSLDALFDGPDYFEYVERHPLYAKHKKVFSRFPTLYKWLKSADILCLKDNNRPLLFLRFR